MDNVQMDKINQELLNMIQRDFPIIERPYKEIALRLKLTEEEVIERLKSLKGEVIRQISAIFDTTKLGYSSSLVAVKFDEDKIEEASEIINQHPGVSHNYKRNHDFNMWFTIAVPPTSKLGLEKTVQLLGEMTGGKSIIILPTLKLFKIGVQLDLTGTEMKTKAEAPVYGGTKYKKQAQPLTEKQIEIIRALQKDLEITPEPFKILAEEAGVSVRELLDQAKSFIETGQMRRFAAVLNHRNAGFSANGMIAWKVPQDKQEEIGYKMAAFRAVSHCYLRPTFKNWPYSIFTMIHGKNAVEVKEVLDMIDKEVNITERIILYSTKEYKKTRVQYFTPEIEEWERVLLK
jgi:DNA-binding Lrp family transcriptional regulator